MRSLTSSIWENQQNEWAPAKTQISLGIHPVWSESSLCAQWVAKTFDWSVTQADLSSLGAQPHCWFCHVAAHLYLLLSGSVVDKSVPVYWKKSCRLTIVNRLKVCMVQQGGKWGRWFSPPWPGKTCSNRKFRSSDILNAHCLLPVRYRVSRFLG